MGKVGRTSATGAGRVSRPKSRKAEPAASETPTTRDFLAGGGEMAELIRRTDWSRTTLGPLDRWPQSLRSAVSICLGSRFPIVIYWGSEFVVLYNDAYAQILASKHPQALGKPCREVWAEIWDVIGPMLRNVVTSSEATWSDNQLLVLQRHGFPEECYFSFSFSPVRSEDDGVGGVFTAVIEHTQQVVGERRVVALRDLGAKGTAARTAEEACAIAARTLSEHALDVPFALIYLFDSDGRLARLAGAAGIEADDRVSRAAIELGAGTADRRPWPLTEAIRTGVMQVVEALAGPFDKSVPPGPWADPPRLAVVVPIRSSVSQQPAGMLVAGVSAQLRLDELYRSFYELVASQIASSVANARAYEAERRRAEALAEIDRAKTVFFSNVSHEFRTPLTLMIGPLEDALASSDLPAIGRERLDVAYRNSLRLLKLVNSLLDFSRIEAGRVQADYEPTDLAALTVDLASNFRSACARAGLELVVDCPPLPGPVHVDRDMWEKIVLNLLSNAFKFTFAGEIAIRLRAVDGQAELSVRDTGVGIPEGELPHLFERFHRIEGQTSRTHEGSGIGLALVQELVKLHGGAIHVDSKSNQGTNFTIRIPFGTAHLPQDRIGAGGSPTSTAVRADAYVEEALRWLHDEAAPSAEVPNEIVEPGDSPRLRDGVRILLADDNADMRAYVRRLLEGNCEIEAVPDGEAALQVLRQRRPDLVLADVMMPRLDGLGLLRAIRADPALRDLPVIMLSARAGEESKVEGFEAGADDYLVKPFSARELIVRIGSNLRLVQARREADGAMREEARTLEILNRIGPIIAGELDLERAVQAVTDAATELTGAAFGAFFYNVTDERGESYMLYALAGASREAFSKFPLPRSSALFAPTFNGEGIVRADDVLEDPRYGRSEPYYGMPEGHLPVRSYLAAPVVSRAGEVLGGLFFGHPEPGVFTERSERLLAGIAPQAAIAIDNGRLYQAAQLEIVERRRAEEATREGEERLQRVNAELAGRLADLQTAHAEVRDARRAALNLMEDAVRSSHVLETLNQQLRESERRFREMIDALPMAIYTTDADGRITHFNPAAVEFSGRTPELATDRWCVSWKLYHADGTPMPHDQCPMAMALKEGRTIRGAEAIIERPDGTRRWFMSYPTPLLDAEGRVSGGIKMLVDITERKEAEERRRVLTHELAHRSKNLLAVVQAIVSRSLSGGHSLDEARDTLDQRIRALSRSHSLLLNGGFDGAPLGEVVRLEFEGFSDRVEVSGPDMVLNSRATQAFALVLHELATNATKHGALSRPKGRVLIDWSIAGAGDDARFRFRWLERGGPPVTPPTRNGFGRLLIERSVEQDFGAQPTLEFAPEGLRYGIDAPLSAVAGADFRPER